MSRCQVNCYTVEKMAMWNSSWPKNGHKSRLSCHYSTASICFNKTQLRMGGTHSSYPDMNANTHNTAKHTHTQTRTTGSWPLSDNDLKSFDTFVCVHIKICFSMCTHQNSFGWFQELSPGQWTSLCPVLAVLNIFTQSFIKIYEKPFDWRQHFNDNISIAS